MGIEAEEQWCHLLATEWVGTPHQPGVESTPSLICAARLLVKLAVNHLNFLKVGKMGYSVSKNNVIYLFCN